MPMNTETRESKEKEDRGMLKDFKYWKGM